MIHSYKLGGYNIVLDICSGAVHVVDEVAYDIIAIFTEKSEEEILALMNEKYEGKDGITAADIRDCYAQVKELKESGQLFTEDPFRPMAGELKKKTAGVIKALCLHVAHTCNLNCSYCFASQGKYQGDRALMSFEVGKQAFDFLIANSGTRKNLEVDFFGGEPLMNFQVVKDLVKYARSIKKSYRAQEPVMDLVQAGNIGLMRAVDKFEVDKGYAFSTYASWWIKQSIIRHIFDNESSIRVPVHMSERFVSLSRAIRNFQEENGREPTFEELSKRVNITKKEYEVFKSLDRNVISLNTVINEESDTEIIDFIPCTEAADPVYEETHQKMLCETINDVLARLETRESYIIKARYGLDGMPAKTLEEIGRDLGITRERVRQIETIAMKKLRTSVKAEALRAYR